ncbi:hypothetical protein LBMAG21_16310 [Armatimonadota bacterium]|nr:hypothetical protein LBMAG21_16310 [Armatimonadota bacterium]
MSQLRVSANGRYLVQGDGTPFFYLGDTAWLIFQRLNRTEVDEYLQDRASKGFTVIQAYVVRGLGEHHPDGPVNLSGAFPFLNNDSSQPNPTYFENMDYVIRRANELGMAMALVIAKSWHINSHPERIFDVESGYAFAKFLAERYKEDEVIWYVGGDSKPGSDESIWLAMARGLKDGSHGEQLISYHGSGGTTSATWFHNADWLDFNSIQSGHGWAAKTYKYIETDYAMSPPKPTIDMEPSYENHPTGANSPRIDSHQVRKGAYWAMLSGAAGHGYGAMDLFFMYKEGDAPFPRDGYQSWRVAMAYEGSRQVGYMRRLFEQFAWEKLVPDQSLIVSENAEGEDHVQAAIANDGSFAILYIPTGKPLHVRLGKLVGKEVDAEWYNPREDSRMLSESAPKADSLVFTPPSMGDKEDWVLVLVGRDSGG